MKNNGWKWFLGIFGFGLILMGFFQFWLIWRAVGFSFTNLIYIGPAVYVFCGLLLLGIMVIADKQMKRMGSDTLSSEQVQSLKQNGTKIAATVEHLEQVTNFRHNMRSPYILHVQGKDPHTNQDKVYKSEWIWKDPFIAVQNRKVVDVYVDKTDKELYWVDISFI